MAQATTCGSGGGGTDEPDEPEEILLAEGFMSSKGHLTNTIRDGYWTEASATCVFGAVEGVFFDTTTSSLLYVATNLEPDFVGRSWFEWFAAANISYVAVGAPRTCTVQSEDLSDGECDGTNDGWCTRTYTVQDIELRTVNGEAP